MSKADQKKNVREIKFVEGPNVLKLNENLGRTIPYEEFDEKILSKRDYYYYGHNKRNPNHLVIPLTKKVCKVSPEYRLSNLPVLCEKRSMQDYHFDYTPEQLKEMYKTPKVIIDKFCGSFTSSAGMIQRTSFYMIAPASQENIPSLYRLSVATCPQEPDHYSISMHAIVGGKADGWLFLGRLDSDTVEPHKIAESEYTPKELKDHNAAKIKCFTAIDMRVRDRAKTSREESLPDIYCIPFPHMHKPDPHYEVGEDIERNLPKFMKNCVDKTLEENISYFLKMFNISGHLHIREDDETISQVRIEERRKSLNFDDFSAKEIIGELFEFDKTKEIMAHYQRETRDEKKAKRREKARVGKKEVYIQNKERIFN